MKVLYNGNKGAVKCFAAVLIGMAVLLFGCGDSEKQTDTDVVGSDTTVSSGDTTSQMGEESSGADADTVPVSDDAVDETVMQTTAADSQSVPDLPSVTVDFDALHEENPDIYAWITIPDTTIDYPILQRTDDNSYYLRRNALGKSDIYGCIFTENYNALDFEDPVTLIYGHTAKNGRMFGTLETNYSSSGYFAEHNKIYIYLPDGEYSYTVFAAVPYSNQHIMYYHDFTDEDVFTAFFRQVMSIRQLNAVFDREAAPKAGDKVIILSTCLLEDNTKRFLVMAKRDGD